MITLLIGILGVAAVSTAGDFAWFELGVGSHRMTAGIIHGAVLLTAVGAALGASAGRLVRGLPIGAIAGVGGALTYYAIAGRGRRTIAMVVAWAACWLILAALEGRVLRSSARSAGEILGRGLTAAALGGAAFYLMLPTLWGNEANTHRHYVVQFLAWIVAWAPGMLALAAGSRPRQG